MNEVQLAHGSGGQAMQQLISQLFIDAFANPWLSEQEDQARLDLATLAASGDRLAFPPTATLSTRCSSPAAISASSPFAARRTMWR
jgi:hydrogenase maturation factor